MHLNRVIKKYDVNMIYISGPGHGGPAVVGNTYFEGTYNEVYPMSVRMRPGYGISLSNFRFLEEFPVMHRRSVRARSTRAVSLAIRSTIHLERPSTIPISSSLAS